MAQQSSIPYPRLPLQVPAVPCTGCDRWRRAATQKLLHSSAASPSLEEGCSNASTGARRTLLLRVSDQIPALQGLQVPEEGEAKAVADEAQSAKVREDVKKRSLNRESALEASTSDTAALVQSPTSPVQASGASKTVIPPSELFRSVQRSW